MSTEDRIRDFIVTQLQYRGKREDLTNDFDLLEGGVVDSLGIFQLTSFMEREFGIEVKDEELVPENFGSIGQLTKLVESKRGS